MHTSASPSALAFLLFSPAALAGEVLFWAEGSLPGFTHCPCWLAHGGGSLKSSQSFTKATHIALALCAREANQ